MDDLSKIKSKESLKVKLPFSAIKFVVNMHFKDEKEAAKQKVTHFSKVLFAKSKPQVALKRRRTLAI